MLKSVIKLEILNGNFFLLTENLWNFKQTARKTEIKCDEKELVLSIVVGCFVCFKCICHNGNSTQEMRVGL